MPRESEINNFNGCQIGFGQKEEILGFQIAVNNALDIVAIPNGVEDVADQFGRIVFAKVSFRRLCLGNDAIKEFSARTEFGD